METKLGQEPAFPRTDGTSFATNGMSKRFYAACAAMQGLLANGTENIHIQDKDILISRSYQYADELLLQENL